MIIGFDRKIRVGWLDATARLAAAGLSAANVRERLDDVLDGEVAGESPYSARGKTKTVLLHIWVTVPEATAPLRDEALELVGVRPPWSPSWSFRRRASGRSTAERAASATRIGRIAAAFVVAAPSSLSSPRSTPPPRAVQVRKLSRRLRHVLVSGRKQPKCVCDSPEACRQRSRSGTASGSDGPRMRSAWGGGDCPPVRSEPVPRAARPRR